MALNGGVAGGRATYGAAAGWAPATGRWQVAGGVAGQDPGPGYENPALAAGARGAVAVLQRPRLGVVAFAGAGLSRQSFAAPSSGVGGEGDPSAVTLLTVPVGVAAGVRGALGSTRAWAVSAAPHYAWTRFDVGDDVERASRARLALLGEVALTRRVGVALAAELGGQAPRGQPGARGTIVGAALALAFGGGGANTR